MKAVGRRKSVLVVFSLALFSLWGCLGGPPEGVRVSEVTRRDMTRLVTAVGKLEAAQTFDVTPAVSGTIAALHVRDGDYVQAGQVLATLDREELAAQEAQARADYLTSLSIGDLLRSQWENSAGLYEGVEYATKVYMQLQKEMDAAVLDLFDLIPSLLSYLPEEERERLESAVEEKRREYMENMASRPSPPDIAYSGYPSSAAAADAARAEAARRNYERTKRGTGSPDLVAPVTGYVVFVSQARLLPEDIISGMLGGLGSLVSGMGDIFGLLGGDLAGLLGGIAGTEELRVGSKVSAGRPVFQVMDLQDMLVRAQVEEVDIPLVQKEQEVDVYLDAYPDRVFRGKVIQVGVKAESGSGGSTVFPVVVQLDRSDVPLRLGYSATLDIKALHKTGVISVPVVAVLSEEGRDYVYVVEDGKAHRREVRTGIKAGEWVEVLSGLEEGERVVVEGASKVREGQRVE